MWNIIRPYLAAALQFNPQLYKTDINIQRLYKMVEMAAIDGAKLIVTPEMAITGYHFRDRKEIAQYVDTAPGNITETFSQLARKYDCYIALGLPELDRLTGLYYNSAALVGPQGYIGKYRKTHLWETEAQWAVWGNLGVPVFDTAIGRLSMLICMDAYFFETFRLAAIQGADVVAFLTNSSGGALANLQARAAENGLYVVSANRSDQELDYTMRGASSVWNPTGKLLAEGGTSGELIVQALIGGKHCQNRESDLLEQRRPEIYQDLALHIAPWDSQKNNTPHQLTTACCQYKPVIGDKEANMAKVKELVAKASNRANRKGQKVDLLVLPELSFCGPPELLEPEQVLRLAEQVETAGITGNSLVFVSALARSLNTNVIFGLIERDADKLYNTALLIGYDGSVLGKYRKTHLSDPERAWGTAGSEFTVVSVPGIGRVGMALGTDMLFPEVFTLLAIKRADLVAIPSAWAVQEGERVEVSQSIHPDSGKAQVYWDIRARDNCFYLLVANYVEDVLGYQGGSGVYAIDPIYGIDKSIFLGATSEDVLVTDIKTLPENWYTQDHFLACRRMDHIYYSLVASNQVGTSINGEVK